MSRSGFHSFLSIATFYLILAGHLGFQAAECLSNGWQVSGQFHVADSNIYRNDSILRRLWWVVGVPARRVLFDLVCGGMVMERAATAVGVSSRTGYRWWSQAGSVALKVGRGGGGLVRPGNPDTLDGPRHRLSLNERIAIMRLVDQGVSQADVARRIGRSPATVCRELKRNRNADGDYHAAMAHARAAERACRPKRFKLVDHPLTGQISEWLEQGWSPKLISTWLAQRFPGDTLRQVSHETIYQCLYVQTRGSLRADLWKQLSTRRAARKPRNRVERRGKPYAEAFTIAQRSPEADDRAVPGHWESQCCCQAA